jgi:hypothetical protein
VVKIFVELSCSPIVSYRLRLLKRWPLQRRWLLN